MSSQPRRMLLRPLSPRGSDGSAPVPPANAAMFNQVQRSRVSPGSLSQGCLSLHFIPSSGIQLECRPSAACLRHPRLHPPPFPKNGVFPPAVPNLVGFCSSEGRGCLMGISGEELLAGDPALEHLLRVEGSTELCSHHCSSFLLLVSSFSAGFSAFSKP